MKVPFVANNSRFFILEVQETLSFAQACRNIKNGVRQRLDCSRFQ